MTDRDPVQARELCRRELLVLAASTAAGIPSVAFAQNMPLPVIGLLSDAPPGREPAEMAGFHLGLADHGYVQGRNVAIEVHSAFEYDRLLALAADIVRRRVAVIVAIAPKAALAAKAATKTIPIVFNVGVDPVAASLVESLGRPGGNATGIALLQSPLGGKRLELLMELAPKNALLAILTNPLAPDRDPELREVQAAAQQHGRELMIFDARTEREIEAAFAGLARARVGGLLVVTDAFLMNLREVLISHVARLGIAAVYFFPAFARAGGLASLGPNIRDARRQVGAYTAQILKGARAADLPVLLPTEFEVIINLKTARALGISIPEAILIRANEVIE